MTKTTPRTPTASELLANPEWVALFGGIHESLLRMIAEDQAERAAKLFAAVSSAAGQGAQQTQRTPADTAKKAQYKCASCGDLFTARVADRKRGWARFCGKSCKAKKQESRTGQYARYQQGWGEGGLCHPSMSGEDIQP